MDDGIVLSMSGGSLLLMIFAINAVLSFKIKANPDAAAIIVLFSLFMGVLAFMMVVIAVTDDEFTGAFMYIVVLLIFLCMLKIVLMVPFDIRYQVDASTETTKNKYADPIILN